jgi:hypothetical protein
MIIAVKAGGKRHPAVIASPFPGPEPAHEALPRRYRR